MATKTPGLINEGTALSAGYEFPFLGLKAKSEGTNPAPTAYLNILLFDEDFNFLDGSFIRVSEAAKENGQNIAHEKLQKQIAINTAGYASE